MARPLRIDLARVVHADLDHAIGWPALESRSPPRRRRCSRRPIAHVHPRVDLL